MTDDQNQPDQDQAYRDAEQAAHAGAAALLEKVGDRVGLHAGAKAVFGDPVKEGGRTVVPVAQVIFGMGAGGGGTVEARCRGRWATSRSPRTVPRSCRSRGRGPTRLWCWPTRCWRWWSCAL